MKKIGIFFFLLIVTGIRTFGQLGVNADNSAPDASAMLDVKSASKGFLPPRVALTAINSALPVAAPVAGLFVYNTVTAGTAPNNVTPGYYCWNGTRWTPVAPPQGTNIGDMLYWNGTQWVGVPAGSNGQLLSFINGVPAWTAICGVSLTVNHVAGGVAPVSKTVTYGTITNIPGEPLKCWITGNLGADHQAISVNDAAEASGGWYWQFNRKQGYRHDGTTRIPNSAWINSVSENSDWLASNDPCVVELGGGWRVPVFSEWANVDASGNWTEWNGPWNSGLRLHAAGFLLPGDGSLTSRGVSCNYWSSGQSDYSAAWGFGSTSGVSFVTIYPKAYGFAIRCVRDN